MRIHNVLAAKLTSHGFGVRSLQEVCDRTIPQLKLSRAIVTSVIAVTLGFVWGCASPHQIPDQYVVRKPACERVVKAEVVALEQVYYYNRFGSFNPAGIMYALRRDVVYSPEKVKQRLEREKLALQMALQGKPSKMYEDELELMNGGLDEEESDGISLPPYNESLTKSTLAIQKESPVSDVNIGRYGEVRLRSDKRPRPLVLRANEGDCLDVTFTNLMAPSAGGQEVINDPELRLTHPEKGIQAVIDGDEPSTRHASMHVNGLSLVSNIDSRGIDVGIESQGVNVGKNGWKGKDGKCSSNPEEFGSNLCALAAPGETRTYRWYAKKEGAYLFYSMGAPAGGEGDGGQIGLGLFGSIDVQPRGAKWYRSQVEENDLKLATIDSTRNGQPIIDYEKVFPKNHPRSGDPILKMTKTLRVDSEKVGEPRVVKTPSGKEIQICDIGELSLEVEQPPMCHSPVILETIYSDLNAVIDIKTEKNCERMGEGTTCGKPYREFTTIFHDEITAVQAFSDIREESSPLSSLRDGMGINYGASGLGAMVVANRKGLGPARHCKECKLEEFFLTSWVNGDPAMVVGYEKDAEGKLIPVCQKDETTKEPKPCKDGDANHQRAPVTMPDGTVKNLPLYKKLAKFPDDPSNVHHSYLGDPVRFRNMHAGPKETHVFHLHAHQWVEDKHDPFSHYLDSQTISPGAVFSYEVHYGGSGNRNLGPGDSIFHCHLYPHFAQGMWELWRTHDVFEDGGKTRRLPDYEITEGTPNPALVPLPRTPLPPMPSDQFKGYPFYIAGEAGHRPPQPPRDLDGIPDSTNTLRRHIILGGETADGVTAEEPADIVEDVKKSKVDKAHKLEIDLYSVGKKVSDKTARRVFKENMDPEHFVLARQLKTARIKVLDEEGIDREQRAMQFHAGTLELSDRENPEDRKAVRPSSPDVRHTDYNWEAAGYPTCDSDGKCDRDQPAEPRILFRVNGGGNTKINERGKGERGAPFSNPCPKQYVDEAGHVHDVMTRTYRTVYIQMDMQVNKAGWHDPQARFPVLEEDVRDTLNGTRPTEPLFFRANSGECVVFKATNLIPSNLNLDDFQVYSPTDTIGQHIHLVKFDVTSSDGSGNGWNYEDGTLAADEVRERIVAYNRHLIQTSNPSHPPKLLEPKTHPLFLKEGAMVDPTDQRGICEGMPMVRKPGESNEVWIKRWNDWAKDAAEKHPWCGAQTTVQRWWADPVLNGKPGAKSIKDRTLRTVFTHDHFGPSSHQHHGFYAALVVEPRNSKWFTLDGKEMGGTDEKRNPTQFRKDGGPTSYAANIIVRDKGTACLNAKTLECSHQLDNKDSIDKERTGREFNLAFADFAIVYDKENHPINPPSQIEGNLRNPVLPGRIPVPEGISTKDPGTQLINYRNEPIPLRIGKEINGQFEQKKDQEAEQGDLANAFSSIAHQEGDNADQQIGSAAERLKCAQEHCPLFTEGSARGRQPGDPATPLLRAYDGDHVQIRLIQGAQEEQHVFTMHGARWLAQPDSPNTGYVNARQIGISEHFEFNDRMVEFLPLDGKKTGTTTDKTGKANGQKGSAKETPEQVVNQLRTADHLYSSGATDNLWDGQWGIMRVYSREEQAPGLARLPGNTERSNDVLASAFLQKEWDEDGDSEQIEPPVSSIEQGPPSKDALEAFCSRKDRKDFLIEYKIEAHLAENLLPMKKLIYNEQFGIADPSAILFVHQKDVSKLKAGSKLPEPLILRAKAGDCIKVTLHNNLPAKMPDNDPNSPYYNSDPTRPLIWSYNMMPPIIPGFNFNQVRSSSHVGLHPQLVDYNLQDSDGARVGRNDDSTVGPGETKTYLWYAGDIRVSKKNHLYGVPYEFGAVPLRDMGDVIKHTSHGAIGALVIEPRCSTWDDTASESKSMINVEWWEPEPKLDKYGQPHKKALRCPDKPAETTKKLNQFRELVLLYQDDLSLQQHGQPIPNLRNGDDSEDSGQKAFNYRTEPLWARLGASAADEPDTMSEFDWSNVLSSTVSHFRCQADWASGKFCDPATPLFTAKAGDHIRFRVVHPGGHPRQHGFTIFGHDWSPSPWIDDSRRMGWNRDAPVRLGSTSGIGPNRAVNIMTTAGGDCKVPGDYLYRTQEGFMFGGGLWGILRVEPRLPLRWYHRSDTKNMFEDDVNEKNESDKCKIEYSQGTTTRQP
ncbi:MAG: hypothetical protein OJF50_006105 [Nitrospira sp.]|nr:hypothetical protein [Nitrospira sp.]